VSIVARNTTFLGNRAHRGGAVYVDQHWTWVSLANVTMTGNAASQEGGALFYSSGAYDGHIRNSILSGNTALTGPDCVTHRRLHSGGGNFFGALANCDVTTGTGDQRGTAAASLAQLKLGTRQTSANGVPVLPLLAGSSAIDAGRAEAPGTHDHACEAVDARGVARPQGAACDSGAYERRDDDIALGVEIGAVPNPTVAAGTSRVEATVVNASAVPLADLVIRGQIASLDAAAQVLAATSSGGTCEIVGSVAECRVDALPAGARATIAWTVAVGANHAAFQVDVRRGNDSLAAASSTILVEEPIVVTSFAAGAGAAGECTLADAIRAANTNVAVNGCRAGSPGVDVIQLPAGLVTFSSAADTADSIPVALPRVASEIIIRGAGANATTLARDAGGAALWLFRVNGGGDLRLEDLTLDGQGGPGAVRIDDGGQLALDGIVATRHTTAVRGSGASTITGVAASTFVRNAEGINHQGTLVVRDTHFTGHTARAVSHESSRPLTTAERVFSENATPGRGAALYTAGPTRIERSRFLRNVAGNSGGAIETQGTGYLTVIDSWFEDNRAPQHVGGAIYAAVWIPEIRGTTFLRNRASDGGAIFSSGGLSDINRSAFLDNVAASVGGAIRTANVSLYARNTTFTGNRAHRGGAIFAEDYWTWVGLANVTITGNTASHEAGGVYYNSGAYEGLLRNSILSGNTALTGPDCRTHRRLQSGSGNFFGTLANCDVTVAAGDERGTAAASLAQLKFGALQTGANGVPTLPLLAGSRAIDAARSDAPGTHDHACEAVDARGVARPQGASCDSGAYERRDNDVAMALMLQATPSPAVAGGSAVFEATIVNQSAASPDQVEVLAGLAGAGGAISDVTSSHGACVTTTATSASCTLPALAPGGSATIRWTVSLAASHVTMVVDARVGGMTTASSQTTVLVEEPIGVSSFAAGAGAPGECTLADAIRAANSNAAVNGCRAGSPGVDIIQLPAGTVSFTSAVDTADSIPVALPRVASEIIIRGAGADTTTLARDAGGAALWLFRVNGGGDLRLEHLTLDGQGGPGAVRIDDGGQLALDGVVATRHTTAVRGSGASTVIDVTGSTFTANAEGLYHQGTLTVRGTQFIGHSWRGVTHESSRSLTVAESVFSDNSSTGRGAALYTAGPTRIERSRFVRNTTANHGGAIESQGTGYLTLLDSWFEDNRAPQHVGGAIYAAVWIPEIRGTTFVRNRAADGGAVYAARGISDLNRSAFLENVAASVGGAIRIAEGSLYARNTTFTGNRAHRGGGIFAEGYWMWVGLANVTMTGNTASDEAGGLYYNSGAYEGLLRNSLLSGNTALTGPDCRTHRRLQSGSGNFFGTLGSCDVTVVAGDERATPAAAPAAIKFGALQVGPGTVALLPLLPGSSAIDGARADAPGTHEHACEPVDARDVPRPQGARCDSGAYEYAASVGGRVTRGGAPLAGAVIEVRDASTNRLIAISTTDATGEYSISVDIGGSLVVKATSPTDPAATVLATAIAVPQTHTVLDISIP
jgi:predicted outer membrane repeat protein